MNDRFRFRIPVTNLDGQFDRFIFCDVYHEPIHFIGSAIFLTPEQCTGLKDNNGNLIYEGDIIELYRGKSNIHQKKGKRFEVKFLTHRFCGFGFGYVDCPSVDMALTESKAKICKVIGNIHENPELLEDK